MTVRFAIPSDREAVIRMMPAANLAAGFGPSGICPLNPSRERMDWLFDQHSSRPDACLIVYAPEGQPPRGFLMAVFFSHPFDDSVRIAKDSGWWVEPDCRGGLGIIHSMLDLYEQWATERGCAYSGMAGMGEQPRVGKIYQRRKYIVAETHYLKAM